MPKQKYIIAIDTTNLINRSKNGKLLGLRKSLLRLIDFTKKYNARSL